MQVQNPVCKHLVEQPVLRTDRDLLILERTDLCIDIRSFQHREFLEILLGRRLLLILF